MISMRAMALAAALVPFALSPALGQSFNGYPCTTDCSGHEAGYEWAQDNEILDEDACDTGSNSFNEGCMSAVEEQEDGMASRYDYPDPDTFFSGDRFADLYR